MTILKPATVGCRLKKEDYDKFDELTKRPGKKQEVIEKLVLDWMEAEHE